MKSNYLGYLTSAQRKAQNREIRRQIAESMTELIAYVEATVLWWEHETKGYGKAKLERELESLKTALTGLKEFYELEDADEMNYACIQNLKAIGFDVSKLGSSMPIEYSITESEGD